MQTPTTNSQLAKAIVFKALHERSGILVIPNPWDKGSARILESLGFEALATTSTGLAFSLGKPGWQLGGTPKQALENLRAITSANNFTISSTYTDVILYLYWFNSLSHSCHIPGKVIVNSS